MSRHTGPFAADDRFVEEDLQRKLRENGADAVTPEERRRKLDEMLDADREIDLRMATMDQIAAEIVRRKLTFVLAVVDHDDHTTTPPRMAWSNNLDDPVKFVEDCYRMFTERYESGE